MARQITDITEVWASENLEFQLQKLPTTETNEEMHICESVLGGLLYESSGIWDVKIDWLKIFWAKANRQASSQTCYYLQKIFINESHSSNRTGPGEYRYVLECRFVISWTEKPVFSKFKHAPCAYVITLI